MILRASSIQLLVPFTALFINYILENKGKKNILIAFLICLIGNLAIVNNVYPGFLIYNFIVKFGG